MSRRAAIGAELQGAAQGAGESLSVGQLMSCARASLLNALDAELERFGLNSTHFLVLKHLGEGAARTAADLCRRNRYDTGAMTRILDRLEEKSLVRRERGSCASHRRGGRCCRACWQWRPVSSKRTSPVSARARSRRSRATSTG